jgi:hypothetical protein
MLALETTLEIRMNLKYLLLTSGLLLTSSLSAADFHQYESARNDKSASRGAEQRAAAATAQGRKDNDQAIVFGLQQAAAASAGREKNLQKLLNQAANRVESLQKELYQARAAAAAAVREANLRENYTKHEQQQGRTRALMKMKINQNLMAMKSLLIHKTLTPM